MFFPQLKRNVDCVDVFLVAVGDSSNCEDTAASATTDSSAAPTVPEEGVTCDELERWMQPINRNHNFLRGLTTPSCVQVYDCHFCGSVQCPVQYTRYLRATYALPLCNTCTINPILFSSTAGGKTPFLAILMCYMLGTQLRERILFTGSEIDTESSLDICGVQLPPKQVALKGMACPSTYTKNTYNRVHIVLFDSLSSSHTFITRVHVHALFCC